MTGIKISIDRIQEGIYIKLPLGWCDHPFLFNNFKINSSEQIALIRNLGIRHVTMYPNRSDVPPLPPGHHDEGHNSQPSAELENELNKLQQELWQQKQQQIDKLKTYRRKVQKSEKCFQIAMTQLRDVMNKLSVRPLNAIAEAEQLIDNIVDSLLAEEHIVLHLMSENKENENIYYHSLNVAVLAMMLGKIKKLPPEQIKIIGMGAMFHDMGKLKIPSQILRKTTPLTPAEQHFLDLHPKYGIDLVELADTFPAEAKPIIAQHHELMDGTGYPRGLTGDKIDPLAQLVAVVDSYDYLCHPMDINKARIPSNALSWLYKNKKAQLNEENLGLMIRLLGIYPPGSVVRLSNEQIGLVMSVNTQRLLYPCVLLYDPQIPRTEAPIIDLATKDLTITGAIKPDKLPSEVYEYLNPRTRINYFFEGDDS